MMRSIFRHRLALALVGTAALVACDGGTDPTVPTTITVSPTTVSFTAVGQTQQLQAAITDQRGDPVEGSALEWASSDEAVATVSPAGLVTAQGPGIAQVTAGVGGIAAVAQISVTQNLANFEAVAGNAQAAPAGQPLPQPLVVEATDELGHPIVGLAVEFAVTAGGGSVSPASTTTDLAGRAGAIFTLGPQAGPGHEVRATVSGTSFSVTFEAAASGQPATLQVFAGNGQSAAAGSPVPVPPSVRVLDATGQPVGGVQVAFAVGEGGGAVSSGLVTTDANGVATLGSWTLGAAGVNTMSATVPGQTLSGDPALFVATVEPAGGFDIRIRQQGTPSSTQLLAFARAEVRWEAVIGADLPSAQVNAASGACGTGSPALSESVDDLLILANLNPIDGPGSVLGAAGPCFIRLPGSLPIVGQMRFDSDDLELLEANDLLEVVILHEMGHVLGIGTLWSQLDLLTDPSLSGGTDPHFTGPLAVGAFNAAGGAPYTGQKVPVEDTGGQGTADSHWRESVFDTELMTGFIGIGANPLSAVTVQSLADQGYTVNLAVADEYSVGAAARIMGPVARRGVQLHDDIARGPIYAVDQSGNVVGVVNR
ncbi:MAG TPA: leishmanolysin-related zinc metalloendopeptidase [Gemmatimonadales bacterium]